MHNLRAIFSLRQSLFSLLWMMICVLVTLPSMADEVSVQQLVSQAKAAIARGDQPDVDRLFDKIYERTTGLDPALKEKPDHLTNADFQKKLCPYRKVIGPLMTTQEIEDLPHEMRAEAIVIVGRKEDNDPYVLAVLQCGQDNDEPVAEALALKKGLEWAHKFEAADEAELHAIALEYEELIQRHPDKELYPWFKTIIELKVDHYRLKKIAEEGKRQLEITMYRKELAEKASQGDLVAQLDVARRLETGDKFKQNKHFAYFWYKRALQNDGGEIAQSGMDRLLPNLDEIDLMRVENWLKKKYVFY